MPIFVNVKFCDCQKNFLAYALPVVGRDNEGMKISMAVRGIIKRLPGIGSLFTNPRIGPVREMGKK